MKSNISFFCILLVLMLSVTQYTLAQKTDDPKKENSIRIAVISDMNSAYGSTSYDESVHSTLDYIIDEVKPDLVLAGGDMIAGQKPQLSDKRVHAMWQAFDEKIAQRLREANIPFAFTIGNHDGSGHPPHQRDRNLAASYWKDSRHQSNLNWTSKEGFPFYYSFNLKEAHIAIWDASTASVPDSNLKWLKNDIRKNSAKRRDFQLLVGHLPLYGVASERDTKGNVLDNPQQMHSLMKELEIDLYVSGHHHAFYPAHKGDIQFLHSGAIGSGPRVLLQSDKPAIKTFTILEISPDANRISYTTYNIENWNRLPHSSLPDSLESRNGTIYLSDEEVPLTQ